MTITCVHNGNPKCVHRPLQEPPHSPETTGRKKHSVQKKITCLAKSTQEIFKKYPYLMSSVAKNKGGNISLIPPKLSTAWAAFLFILITFTTKI